MDVKPENINPEIVSLAKVNPKVREIFEVYLAEAEIDGEILTWAHALEMMVIKLGQQYGGALAGWKDSTERAKSTQLALVNEKLKCPDCEHAEFLVTFRGARVCGYCMGVRGKRSLIVQKEVLRNFIQTILSADPGQPIPQKAIQQAQQFKALEDTASRKE